jgi:RES domain-containing protein
MTVQRLDRPLTCYRIGDPNGTFPIFDAEGSRLYPGRWNTADTPVIYTGENYATAMLEKLVHGAGRLPPNQHFVTITVPRGASYEIVTKDHLPGWDSPEPGVSRTFGADWVRGRRSLLLLVPSFVARMERNVVINPVHPDFATIKTSLAEPVWWDRRLFQR